MGVVFLCLHLWSHGFFIYTVKCLSQYCHEWIWLCLFNPMVVLLAVGYKRRVVSLGVRFFLRSLLIVYERLLVCNPKIFAMGHLLLLVAHLAWWIAQTCDEFLSCTSCYCTNVWWVLELHKLLDEFFTQMQSVTALFAFLSSLNIRNLAHHL